ncbi:MAG TPA: D-tyrosyl-tRNA(Tyr) deacylase [Chloroflexi bacterium]|nr:D-tyrosyl-tRNA(Tyr) deacylase [Chloroflexota bacterium]HAL27644.1 D-tyrosyl-tRNA(Tyr) deacylase [Chloroflexota bacterium]
MIQRVRAASVEVDGERTGSIGRGLVVLLGVGANDTAIDGERLAAKIASLRIFDDGSGKLQNTVAEANGSVLVVPQFTLYGDVRRGRRPDFTAAAPPDAGRRFYDAFCGVLRANGLTVSTGVFGAAMRVQIDADGPVTVVASTDRWSEGEL